MEEKQSIWDTGIEVGDLVKTPDGLGAAYNSFCPNKNNSLHAMGAFADELCPADKLAVDLGQRLGVRAFALQDIYKAEPEESVAAKCPHCNKSIVLTINH